MDVGGNKRVLSPRVADPYLAIKQDAPQFAVSLLNLPNCPVWIHEKALYKVLKLPSSPAFGQRQSLNCLMKGIERGYCGNMRGDYIALLSTVPDFSHEKNSHRVSYQYNGRKELFSNGDLLHATNARPRWFLAGDEPGAEVTTQKAIVEELLGEATGLSEEEEDCRSNNYIEFLKDAEEDGGYRRIDVPSLAYQFRDHWGKGIRVGEQFVRKGYVLRRAFTPKDITYIEDIMHLMIASCNRYADRDTPNSRNPPPQKG